MEVTFNHAEAMPWTLIRPTLADQSDEVLPEARIEAGAVIIGTDDLKGLPPRSRRSPGWTALSGRTSDYSLLLPRLKWVVPVPLVVLRLDWADGGMEGPPKRINLHGTAQRSLPFETE